MLILKGVEKPLTSDLLYEKIHTRTSHLFIETKVRPSTFVAKLGTIWNGRNKGNFQLKVGTQ